MFVLIYFLKHVVLITSFLCLWRRDYGFWTVSPSFHPKTLTVSITFLLFDWFTSYLETTPLWKDFPTDIWRSKFIWPWITLTANVQLSKICNSGHYLLISQPIYFMFAYNNPLKEIFRITYIYFLPWLTTSIWDWPRSEIVKKKMHFLWISWFSQCLHSTILIERSSKWHIFFNLDPPLNVRKVKWLRITTSFEGSKTYLHLSSEVKTPLGGIGIFQWQYLLIIILRKI